MNKIQSSEITPEHVYLSRRKFLKASVLTAAGAALMAACGIPTQTAAPGTETPAAPTLGAGITDELGSPLTSFDAVTGYNNFYEFTTSKEGVARLAANFITSPWQVQVGGLVNRPGVYDIDALRTKFDQEERILRLRCVEAWSMVIPWVGFPLSKLLKEVEPKPEAKYVRFESVYAPEQMPGQKDPFFPFPYIEGLRIDEAMNDLTLLATGLYGKTLTPQNGAPIRLVVPWKYGFKSIKSIVKIDLVSEMPASLWMSVASNEYGFYANVNPEVSHPRWSQASERRIGENSRRDTLKFNGYDQQVASLYNGMDLKINY